MEVACRSGKAPYLDAGWWTDCPTPSIRGIYSGRRQHRFGWMSCSYDECRHREQGGDQSADCTNAMCTGSSHHCYFWIGFKVYWMMIDRVQNKFFVYKATRFWLPLELKSISWLLEPSFELFSAVISRNLTNLAIFASSETNLYKHVGPGQLFRVTQAFLFLCDCPCVACKGAQPWRVGADSRYRVPELKKQAGLT